MSHPTFLRRGLGIFAFIALHLWQINGQNCSSLPAFNFTFNSQNPNINVPTVFPANSNIRITGTVNFNANVTMPRCTLLMDPGAILNINNSTFTLTADVAGNRSVIFGCTTMWQAINVNQGAAVIFRDCTIGDGRLGLVFNQGFNNSLTELRGNYFVANSTAITANNVNIFTFATFSGNVFRAKWGIGPFVLPLLPPHGANEPIYGMQLTGVAGTIGTSGTQNAFYQFTSAILANNSNFTVNNCRFADNRDPGWGGWGGGVGIWAINSTLTIQNLFSNAASCEFIGNRRAVRSENTIGLTIKNAHFQQQAVVDIEVISSINPCNIDISNNIIDIAVPTERSIFVERSGQGGLIHTRVQSNVVTFPSPALGTFLTGDRRIMEFQARAGAFDQAVIANNQITCSYGNGNQTNAFARTIDGIWIQGLADGYQVSGNIINYTNPNAMPNADVVSVAIGMVTNNGINNILGPNNTITSQLFINQPIPLRESWLRCGLHIVGSVNAIVCKNDVDGTRHGYHFDLNCANIEFGRNKIRNADLGLTAWQQFPNNHDYRMNEWIPSAPYNTRSAESLTPPPPPTIYRWRVDGTQPGHLPPTPPPTAPANWFNNAPNGGVTGTPVCDAVLPPPGGFGEPPTGSIAQKFLNDEYGGLTNPAIAWDFERTLLGQMIRFPSSFSGNTTAEQYYNSKVNSTVWQFAKAERMLHDATAVSTPNQQSLDQLSAYNKVLADSLGVIEQWEGADTLTVNLTWQAVKTNLLAQISSNQVQISALNNTVRARHLTNLENVRTYVNNLPASSDLEANYRTVLTLTVKQHMGESWTNQDSTDLRTVANLCPETYGEAVVIARGMLPAPESYSFGREGNDTACGQLRSDGGIPSAKETAMIIWPNPADNMLTIGFERPFSGTLEIINSSGAVVRSLGMNETVRENIPTDILVNGIYFLRVSASGQAAQTQKFSVLH